MLESINYQYNYLIFKVCNGMESVSGILRDGPLRQMWSDGTGGLATGSHRIQCRSGPILPFSLHEVCTFQWAMQSLLLHRGRTQSHLQWHTVCCARGRAALCAQHLGGRALGRWTPDNGVAGGGRKVAWHASNTNSAGRHKVAQECYCAARKWR